MSKVELPKLSDKLVDVAIRGNAVVSTLHNNMGGAVLCFPPDQIHEWEYHGNEGQFGFWKIKRENGVPVLREGLDHDS